MPRPEHVDAPSEERLMALLLDHLDIYGEAKKIADDLWPEISRWIGNAQASEFKVGYDSGYGEGYRHGAQGGSGFD